MADTTLPGVLLKGAAASRPAASAVAKGTIYSATDTGAITQSDGSSWSAYATITAGIAATLFDAKGDLIVASAADTAARLAVGTNGQVLTANSGATNGVEWAAAASGSFVGAKAYTTGVSVSNAVIDFASGEVYDTDAFHSTGTNPSRMTIPSGKDGYYLVHCSTWASRQDYRLEVYVNGSVVRGRGTGGASTQNYQSTQAVLNLSAGDYVEIFCATVASTTIGDNGSVGDNGVFSITRVG